MKADIKQRGLKPRRQSGRGWDTIHKRLLTGSVAIGGIATAGDQALAAQGLQVVPSPFINNSILSGAAIIADHDIWAVGDVAGGNANTEGQSWAILATPSGVRGLNGVAAHSDGTIVAVGVGTNNSAVILHN
ncbi:MAG: hypothetical protein ABSH34_18295 [Verrucomicrobiota bacterium]|jgi:hypothetical protein